MTDIRAHNRKIRCVIYDCDGVLFDSLESNRRLYEYLCRAMDRPLLSEAELMYVHSHTRNEAIHFLFGRDDDLESNVLNLVDQVDLRKYIEYLRMEPHVLETMTALKDRGIIRAICTSRTTGMKHIMDQFKLWPYFEMVVTAMDVEHPKPHPESVDKILQRFYLRKEEAVYVGDSEVDRQTARASGIQFVAYKNRDMRNEIIIENHLDLLALISHPRTNHARTNKPG